MAAAGINKQILDVLRENHLPEAYDLEEMRDLIERFLNEDKFSKRTKMAAAISKQALKRHKKNGGLHPFVSRMIDIERGVQHFSKSLRDHISHSVYVYLLGLAFIEKTQHFSTIDPLSWKIAALLHDVGYPPEWFANSIKEYLDEVSKASGTPSNDNTKIRYSSKIHGIELLKFSTVDAFQIIDDRLREWDIHLTPTRPTIRSVFEKDLEEGKINHGILSSLTILRVVDSLYLQNNLERMENMRDGDNLDWGSRCFSRQIIEAVAAVSTHAILNEIDRIRVQRAPVAHLLVLCDTLQLWSRYSPKRKIYDPSTVSIDFGINQILCELAVDDRDFVEVECVVNNKLHSENLRIQVHKRND